MGDTFAEPEPIQSDQEHLGLLPGPADHVRPDHLPGGTETHVWRTEDELTPEEGGRGGAGEKEAEHPPRDLPHTAPQHITPRHTPERTGVVVPDNKNSGEGVS